MKAGEIKFLSFINGKKHFVIPIYQRTYSWTHEQCQQLWDDIVQAATSRQAEGHFIGSIVYTDIGQHIVDDIEQFMVIDGQQRLTTLSLLLVALAKAFAEESGTSQTRMYENIYESYLTNKFSTGEERYKLLLTQSDKHALKDIIDRTEFIKANGYTNRLVENYLFFVECIRQSTLDLTTIYQGISKLFIVQIALGKDDNPQLIFESLNSTGMDLSQADLIRNYVLMGLDKDEQTKLYENYWYRMEQEFRYADGSDQFDRFMRDYLTIKQGVIPNINRVYASFKSYHRSQIETPIQEVVKDIYRYAQYFLYVALLQEEDQDILEVLNDISTLKVDVAYPFLLEVYDDYANKRLSKKDFIALLRLVESYVFRRLTCGVPTNGLNKVFVTLAKDIDKEHYLESVQATFLAKTRGGRFPNDEEFQAAFIVKDIYNLRIRKYLLSKLENYDDKELVNVEKCTIEHIMPQNERLSTAWQAELGSNWKEIQARYLHTIGNLTLTGYNSELGDRQFSEKRDMLKEGFAHSPIRLSRCLATLEHWNEQEIKKRAQQLADIAVKAWVMPTLSTDQKNQYNMLMQQIPLEVMGPARLPLVGLVPGDFKIIRHSEKRFHLYRLISGNWIQYGNGKKAWHAVSWFWAGEWAREKQRRDEMPLGVGGEIIQTTPSLKATPGIVLDGSNGDDAENGTVLTLDNYPYLQGPMLALFEQLREHILQLDSSVREEYKKLYIAYKTDTNFVDIVPQAKQLRLSLNMKFSEIHDPKKLCRDISGIGRWGNGDVEVGLASPDRLDDVMGLIRQSFEKHWEEDDA